jgi:hypothetical protein
VLLPTEPSHQPPEFIFLRHSLSLLLSYLFIYLRQHLIIGFLSIHLFETASHCVALDGLELVMQTRLPLNFESSCYLSLQTAEIKGIWDRGTQ